MMAYRLASKIPALGSTPRTPSRFSRHSSPPSRQEWEWASRFAARLLPPMADACGQRRDIHAARYFTLFCHSEQVSRPLPVRRPSELPTHNYFLLADCALAFNCASSLSSFATVALSAAISARAAARSRPALAIFSCVSRASFANVCCRNSTLASRHPSALHL